MVYEAWRTNGGPTLYPPNKTPQTVDVLEAGFIFATVIMAFSLLIITPGFTGKSIITFTVKAILGCFITGVIMLCNFGQEWEVAHIHTKTPYRAGLGQEIEADIGVSISLRSVNITLKATPDVHVEFVHGRVKERIDYNERFEWDDLGFLQGNAGFGPTAGLINREFRGGQLKGLPFPILWVAEYFTVDGEGLRWGRHYRQAGYYTHILMWTALPAWVLAMLMMNLVVRYGGYMAIFTSILLFVSNILYATIRNPFDLVIPFEEDVLTFSWGWCFYLNIFNAFLCLIIGVVIVVGDLLFPEHLVRFFGIPALSDYDEIYGDPEEISALVVKLPSRLATLQKSRGTLRPRPPAPGPAPTLGPRHDEDGMPPPLPQKRQYRKRTIIMGRTKKTSDIEQVARATPGWSNGHESSAQQQDIYEMDRREVVQGSDNNRI